MFVVRYLMVAVAVMAGILTWGSAAGYSAWQIAGMSVLAVLALQALILGYVVFAATRNKNRDPSRRGRKQGDQLVILPR